MFGHEHQTSMLGHKLYLQVDWNALGLVVATEMVSLHDNTEFQQST